MPVSPGGKLRPTVTELVSWKANIPALPRVCRASPTLGSREWWYWREADGALIFLSLKVFLLRSISTPRDSLKGKCFRPKLVSWDFEFSSGLFSDSSVFLHFKRVAHMTVVNILGVIFLLNH